MENEKVCISAVSLLEFIPIDKGPMIICQTGKTKKIYALNKKEIKKFNIKKNNFLVKNNFFINHNFKNFHKP